MFFIFWLDFGIFFGKPHCSPCDTLLMLRPMGILETMSVWTNFDSNMAYGF